MKNNNTSVNSHIKTRSITNKASSACKMNMGLVKGTKTVTDSEAFTNYGPQIGKGLEALNGTPPKQ